MASFENALQQTDPKESVLRALRLLGCDELHGSEFMVDSTCLAHLSSSELRSLLEKIDRTDVSGIGMNELLYLFDGASLQHRWEQEGSRSLAAFLCRLAGVTAGTRVYVPFDASFNIALHAAAMGAKVYAQFESQALVDCIRSVNLVLGTNIEVRAGDPVRDNKWDHETFDVAAALLQFGVRGQEAPDERGPHNHVRFPEKNPHYGEVLQVRRIQAQVAGRAVVVAPAKLIARTAAREYNFKRSLVDTDELTMVIGLPPKVIKTDDGAPVVLVLETRPLGHRSENPRVLMVDAAEEVFSAGPGQGGAVPRLTPEVLLATLDGAPVPYKARFVQHADCAALDFNLTPGRYVVSEVRERVLKALSNVETLPLKDIADVIRAQALQPLASDSGAARYFEITLADVGADDYVQEPQGEPSPLGRAAVAEQQTVKPGDVLLVAKGSVGRAALVPDVSQSKPWVANQTLVILRLKEFVFRKKAGRTEPEKNPIHPVVLLRYLTSPMGQALLAERAGAGPSPFLQKKDIESLDIPIPTPAETERVLRADEAIREKHRLIRQLQAEAESELSSLWALGD
jgi:hypothetical protein